MQYGMLCHAVTSGSVTFYPCSRCPPAAGVIGTLKFSFTIFASSCRQSANFSEGEKLRLAGLCKAFPDIENKGYDGKSLIKKGKAWEGVLATFNAENPTGVKGDRKILQGCWKR